MSSKIQQVDPALINIQHLTRKVNVIAKKRRHRHPNLYARLSNLLHGGVLSADAVLVQDVRDVLREDYDKLEEFLKSAAVQLA